MTSSEMQNPWRTVASKNVYDNPWITVREDAVIRPDGEAGIYGAVHFKNIAVGILALDGDDIYLVGQHRYTLNHYSWEIPEGGCPQGEAPLDAAKRELEEETGLRAGKWTAMGEAHLSNSVSDEYAVWFLATELTKGEPHPDGTERLQVRKISFGEALNMALNGEITDSLSMLAIMQFHISGANL